MEIDPKTGQAAAQAVRTALPVTTTPGALATPAPAPTPAPSKDPAALKAAATGGQAGLTAYQQSLKTIDQLQANALANAQSRASLIGGPEAQGFEALPNQFYDRARANLTVNQQAFQGQQDANRKAFDKYFGQLKGDMGAINDYIKNTLGGYEAKKRAKAEASLQAKFPLDEILGETEYGLPQAQKDADLAKTALTEAITHRDNLKKNAYDAAPLANYGFQATAIRDKLERDTQEYYKKGTTAERKTQLAASMEKNKNRLAKVEELSKQDRSKLTEQRKTDLAAAEKKVAELQADYDKKAAITSPEQYARNIAVSKYGQDPMKAAGKLTPDKFYPKQADEAERRQYGEQAVGLAQKLNITGGAKRVAEVLTQPDVQHNIEVINEWAQEGDKSLNDVKREMAKAYLTKGDDYDPDGYNVIIELVARLPWKRSD